MDAHKPPHERRGPGVPALEHLRTKAWPWLAARVEAVRGLLAGGSGGASGDGGGGGSGSGEGS